MATEKSTKVMKKGSTYFYVYVTKDQKKKLKQIAAKKGTTMSALSRQVFEKYIDEQEAS